MNIQYKLLNSGRGVILTRQPDIASGSIHFSFEGAPANATAIITAGGKDYYRSAQDCCISARVFVGDVKVMVAVLESASETSWCCEGLKGRIVRDGVLVAPNDFDLPGQMVEMQKEMHDMRQRLDDVEAENRSLRNQLSSMMEGYDLT